MPLLALRSNIHKQNRDTMEPTQTKTKPELLKAIKEGKSFSFQYFWGVSHSNKQPTKLGCFNQWSPHPISDGDVTFNCAEQAMMVKKAWMFDNYVTANELMKITRPIDMKAKIKGMDKAVWKAMQFDFLVGINLAKFTQHTDIKEVLLSTGTDVLVGASTYDTNLGIGTYESRAATLNVDEWEGENVLGFVLMEVRRILAKELEESVGC